MHLYTEPPETFDQVATNYEALLNTTLAPTGEAGGYFADERVAFLRRQGLIASEGPLNILDFGCGTGGAFHALAAHFPGSRIHGVDPSRASLEVARARCEQAGAYVSSPEDLGREILHHLVFCNGVFHHIQAEDRAEALAYIHARLDADGWFAFFENNPWNPGTRWLMSRCPFDRDAQLICPVQACQLLLRAGFKIHLVRSLFYFPRSLQALRPLEPALGCLPFGGQYVVLARKRGAAAVSPYWSGAVADVLSHTQAIPGLECFL